MNPPSPEGGGALHEPNGVNNFPSFKYGNNDILIFLDKGPFPPSGNPII